MRIRESPYAPRPVSQVFPISPLFGSRSAAGLTDDGVVVVVVVVVVGGGGGGFPLKENRGALPPSKPRSRPGEPWCDILSFVSTTSFSSSSTLPIFRDVKNSAVIVACAQQISQRETCTRVYLTL